MHTINCGADRSHRNDDGTGIAQSSLTLEKRATAKSADRYGDVPLGAVIRTDERYNKIGLFEGPRGWDYWNYLENPKPYQDPGLLRLATTCLFFLPIGSEAPSAGHHFPALASHH